MKKIAIYSPIITFVLYTFIPVCFLVALLGKYEFSLRNITISAIVIMTVSIFLTILAVVQKEIVFPKRICIFAILSLPMSLLNYFCVMFHDGFSVIVALFTSVSCVCAGILFFGLGYSSALKVIMAIVSTLVIVPLFLLTFIVLVFGNIQYNTVVESIESPDGAYLAVVTDSDQGAMGGDTYVDVYDQKQSFSIYIAEFLKVHSRVYEGDWGEYKHMKIEWKDKNTLLINDEFYLIN